MDAEPHEEHTVRRPTRRWVLPLSVVVALVAGVVIGYAVSDAVATNDWLVVSAVVQALASAAIVGLTYFLVRFTRDYVSEMSRANELQAQANAISSTLASRQMAMQAPFLLAANAGSSGSVGGICTARIEVENRGGSLAYDIIVKTSWGNFELASLPAGTGPVRLQVAINPWDGTSKPAVEEFRFKDSDGADWVQKPSEVPVRFQSG